MERKPGEYSTIEEDCREISIYAAFQEVTYRKRTRQERTKYNPNVTLPAINQRNIDNCVSMLMG
jgi:hypothetical protein